MLTPSSGDVRVCPAHAISLNCGIRMTRPDISAGSRSRHSRLTAICPSYSLPCVPPKTATPGAPARVAGAIDHRDRHERVAPAAVELERGAIVVFSGPGEVDCGRIDGLGQHVDG